MRVNTETIATIPKKGTVRKEVRLKLGSVTVLVSLVKCRVECYVKLNRKRQLEFCRTYAGRPL